MATGLKRKGNYNTGMNLLTLPRDINPVLQHQMNKYKSCSTTSNE